MTHRTFISIILVAALAVTGLTSTPARAGNDDIAKWIAGAVALGIIGAAIADRDRNDGAVTRYRNYDNRNYNKHRHYNDKRYYKNQRYKNKQRFNQHVLPGRCQRSFQTRRGQVQGFGRNCLLNNYSSFNALPHKCAFKSRARDGRSRVIYSRYCLQQHGYRVSADRR